MAVSTTRRSICVWRGCAPASRVSGDCAGGFSVATDPDRDRLSAGRRDRHSGSADGPEDVGAVGPAGGRREPSGSEWA